MYSKYEFLIFIFFVLFVLDKLKFKMIFQIAFPARNIKSASSEYQFTPKRINEILNSFDIDTHNNDIFPYIFHTVSTQYQNCLQKTRSTDGQRQYSLKISTWLGI